MFLLWMSFVLVFLLMPVGYGWGYRGWGPPYPAYYRSRRQGVTVPAGGRYTEAQAVETTEPETWGVLADMVWIVSVIAVGWLLFAWIL